MTRMMSIMLAICLLLVIATLILALNAWTRLDGLRHENRLMHDQITQLRQEYEQLQIRLLSAPPAPAGAEAKAESQSRPAESVAAEPEASLSPEQVIYQQMQQVEAVLQAYQREHRGDYPSSLESLIRFANRHNLQQTVTNPYTQARNPLLSEDVLLDITHDPADEGLAEYAGRLLYQARLSSDERALGYTLAAFDSQGSLLKAASGEVRTLSYPGVKA